MVPSEPLQLLKYHRCFYGTLPQPAGGVGLPEPIFPSATAPTVSAVAIEPTAIAYAAGSERKGFLKYL